MSKSWFLLFFFGLSLANALLKNFLLALCLSFSATLRRRRGDGSASLERWPAPRRRRLRRRLRLTSRGVRPLLPWLSTARRWRLKRWRHRHREPPLLPHSRRLWRKRKQPRPQGPWEGQTRQGPRRPPWSRLQKERPPQGGLTSPRPRQARPPQKGLTSPWPRRARPPQESRSRRRLRSPLTLGWGREGAQPSESS